MGILNVGDATITPSLPPITRPDNQKSQSIQAHALEVVAASDADQASAWRMELEKKWTIALPDLYVSTPEEYAELETKAVAELEAKGYTCQRVTPENYVPPAGGITMFDKFGNPQIPNVRVLINGEYMVAWGWKIAAPGEGQFQNKLLSLDGLRMALLVAERNEAIERELARRFELRHQDRIREAAEDQERYEATPEGQIKKLEKEIEGLKATNARLLEILEAGLEGAE